MWRRILLTALGLAAAGCTARQAGMVTLPSYQVQVVEPRDRDRLAGGFEEIHGGWRWTAPKFAVRLDVPADRPLYAVLRAGVPGELFRQAGPVTLIARLNGREIGRRKFERQENFTFSQRVADDALTGETAELQFEVDRSFQEQAGGSALGLMVISAGLSNIDHSAQALEELKRATAESYARNREARRAGLSAEEDFALMSVYHKTPTWRSFWFHGIRIEKSPTDLWNMQALIAELRPEFIVETGTFRGGSALYWAHVLNGAQLAGSRVLTVDIADYCEEARLDPLWDQFVEFNLGSSTDPALVRRIAERVRGHRTLVTLDSDHSAPHVLRELRMYGGMVSAGSYLVVEDTEMDGVPTYPETFPGPLAALTLFLKEDAGRAFEPDASRERMGITYNPAGWLRRK